MTLSTQPYKGTRDFYPDDMRFRRWMFGKMREVVERYGYQEYDGPMLEPFELYAAKTGEEIVNTQLYWMMDRGERKIAVRPEMTPTLARMVAAKVNELPRPVRLYSIPNLWRYERPQRGRLREHWQLNVDVMGGDPELADFEILRLSIDLMKAFGGEDKVNIKINHRGLMDHLFSEKMGLSPDAALKTVKAVDARDKIGEEKFRAWLGEIGIPAAAQGEMDRFFKASFQEIEREYRCPGTETLSRLFAMLKEAGLGEYVKFDPTIMRGMDYYTGTVFEMYDISPDNNRAMFGGGRYDNLIGLFGKTQLSGVGLGFGDVTLQNFLETHKLVPKFEEALDVFVTMPSQELRSRADSVAAALRAEGLKVATPLEAGGFGAQLKLATRHGARFAVLFGEEELKRGEALLKDLRKGEQKAVPFAGLARAIADAKGTS